MRHLMSPMDLSVEDLDKLLDLANDIEANPQKYAHMCDGKKLATGTGRSKKNAEMEAARKAIELLS